MTVIAEPALREPRASISLPLLDQIRIASPCDVPWDAMKGDDRRRYCDRCELHVHNISAMTRAEAEAFLQSALSAGGRVCGTFYRRADGTILTQDCPVGLAALRRRARNTGLKVLAVVLTMLGMGSWLRARESERGWRQDWRQMQPYERVCEWLGVSAPALPPPAGGILLGDISWPPPANGGAS